MVSEDNTTPPSTSNADVDLENGRRSRPRQRSKSTSGSSSDYEEEEKDLHHDGHRPSRRELHESISRSRSTRSLARDRTVTATASGMNQPLGDTISRRDTVLSRIRTRPNVAPFSHPLAHQQTTADVLVDFDGDDDPYRPMNWKSGSCIGYYALPLRIRPWSTTVGATLRSLWETTSSLDAYACRNLL